MKFRVFLNSCILGCLCCAGVAQANVDLMPIEDLRAGMKGIGKTVIKGDTIENFDVEILGVQGSETTGESIFVKLSGDLIEKTGGVAQGMSGSPVYVDGRLVGAVAYGRTFDDHRYCFLTPIHQMLDLVDEVHYSSAWLPKGTALSAGGFTEEGLNHLKERLLPYELDAVPGGTGEGSAADFQPGSSVGVSLINGDLTLGALGTVTWVGDDGSLLAFGHPFLKRGTTNFFMNKVWIWGTVPNQASNYKVGEIGQVAGKIVQDRASGVAGEIGNGPQSIPLVVTVGDFDRGVHKTISVNLVEDELLLPELVDAAVYNCVTLASNRVGGGTAQLTFDMDALNEKGEKYQIHRDNMYFATMGLLKNVDNELFSILGILSRNKFDTLDVRRIRVDVKVTEDLRVAEVKEISVPKKPYHAGDEVPVLVKMKPYRGEEFQRVVNFMIPEDFEGEKITLSVRGGSSLLWLDKVLKKKRQEDEMPLQSKESKTVLKDYIDNLKNGDKNNELIVDVGGKVFSKMLDNKEDKLAILLKGTPAKVKKAYDFVVVGDLEISFNVK